MSVQSAPPPQRSESGPGRSRQDVSLRISIVVPTRNRVELLGRMLRSLQSQTHADYEVIVVDDASTTATREGYVALWGELDSRFILLTHGTPGGLGTGPSAARNAGIAAATGSVIAFCDDDDFWTDNGHLAAMAQAFSERSDLDLYIANQIAVSSAGRTEKNDWLPGLTEIVRSRGGSASSGYLVSVDELARCGGFAQLNILALRKALTLEVGGFWTRTSYEEDRDFFWRAVDRARAILFNPKVVAQHNIPDPARRNNLSSSFTQAERWLISALVSQHIGLSVASPAIRKLCLAYEGDILRHLSLSLSSAGQHGLGLQYARRALAARGSLKWALYTMTLMCRQLLRRQPA